MPRLIVAYATAAAIVATAVPVIAEQRPVRSARPATVRPSPIRTAPSVVQKDLQRNGVLADNVRTRLPLGADVLTAAAGFRRLELFVATVYASHDLAVPFVELKRRIVNDGMTLGQAIQDIRPKSRYWLEARKAEDDAAAAIRTSEAIVLASTRR